MLTSLPWCNLSVPAEPVLCLQQQQQAAGDLLHMFMAGSAQPASDTHMHGSSWAEAAPQPLLETAADAGWPAAAPAQCAEQSVEAAGAAAPTSLGARFARLPARVQEDILRQLDELSALEDETRSGRDAEAQGGPRVSLCMLALVLHPSPPHLARAAAIDARFSTLLHRPVCQCCGCMQCWVSTQLL